MRTPLKAYFKGTVSPDTGMYANEGSGILTGPKLIDGNWFKSFTSLRYNRMIFKSID